MFLVLLVCLVFSCFLLPACLDLRRRAKRKKVTLLFGAKDEQHNNAVALREFLIRRAA